MTTFQFIVIVSFWTIFFIIPCLYFTVFYDMISERENHKTRKELLTWLKEGKIKYDGKHASSFHFKHVDKSEIKIHLWFYSKEVSVFKEHDIICLTAFAGSFYEKHLKNKSEYLVYNLIPLRDR